MTTHTITGLRRWSCQDKELPPVSQIKAIHVYDFDNTLFNSPLPNPKLWNGPTLGYLQTMEGFTHGGWWHDPNILGSTGDGIEQEEQKAWEGWWNEQIVSLVELTMQQKDALNVLLTGRGEARFADLIKRIVESKKLDFDMVCLKVEVGPSNQRFSNTMNYKQGLLKDLIHTYTDADEIRVYEDRPKHVRGFRDFFTAFNKALMSPTAPTPRKPITAEVVQVAEGSTTLSPITETAEVQRMINSHNASVPNHHGRLAIKRTIFYTGYIISPLDTTNLLSLINLPTQLPDNEVKILANNILITPRPCPRSILDKVGGIGKKFTWQVTGTAVFENKVWAARVSPVPETERYYTENPVPMVVLAVRKGARPQDAGRIQNWQPVPPEKAYTFDTVVGEKVLLRVEEENPHEGDWESLFPNRLNSRKHPREDIGQLSEAPRNQTQNQIQNQTTNHQSYRDTHFPTLPNNKQPIANQSQSHPHPAQHQNPSLDNRRGGTSNNHISYQPRAPNTNRGGRGGYRGHQARGGRGNIRGGDRGGRGRGRGGGPHGGGGYKSLDDVNDNRGHGYPGQENERGKGAYGAQGGLPYNGY
ncbi:MAG: hypothetical protein M1812_000988 [Candelaria pacifica]|nr:MAG: hypothetical protein M1812_000988 [Candelaria pacifica]